MRLFQKYFRYFENNKKKNNKNCRYKWLMILPTEGIKKMFGI